MRRRNRVHGTDKVPEAADDNFVRTNVRARWTRRRSCLTEPRTSRTRTVGNPRRQADDRARVTLTRMVQEVLLDWPGAEIDPILDTSADATVDVEEHPPNMAAIVNLEELGRNIVVEVKSSRERQERGQRRADQDVPHVSAVRKTFEQRRGNAATAATAWGLSGSRYRSGL